ncbi:hypothetical protein ACS0TY_024516 [Phlomoides rotata]
MILGFGDAITVPEGTIRLSVELVSAEDLGRCLTRMVDFLVVDQMSTYNGFFGRPFISEFKAVVSTYYYCVKFPTLKGTGTIKGDQKKARECLLSLAPGRSSEVSMLAQDPSSGQDECVSHMSARLVGLIRTYKICLIILKTVW